MTTVRRSRADAVRGIAAVCSVAAVRRFAAALLVALSASFVAAPALPADDPAFEARIKRLESELRCLVCQNQTIAESNAELAVDLRRQVKEQIAAGRSDAEIVDFMTARYGDFVLYKPPFKAITALLWLGPVLLLVVSALVLTAVVRRRRNPAAEPELTPEQRARAAKLLAGGDGGSAR
jgi:cytochrome c-type biogenesis protein CcmH